jgi:hypothetical protein
VGGLARPFYQENEMAIGPGKYDDEVTEIMKSTQANGAILIVIGGNKGEGFCCQATLEVTLRLPKMLRLIADQLEADMPDVDKQDG